MTTKINKRRLSGRERLKTWREFIKERVYLRESLLKREFIKEYLCFWRQTNSKQLGQNMTKKKTDSIKMNGGERLETWQAYEGREFIKECGCFKRQVTSKQRTRQKKVKTKDKSNVQKRQNRLLRAQADKERLRYLSVKV